jgi:hypothetical protein
MSAVEFLGTEIRRSATGVISDIAIHLNEQPVFAHLPEVLTRGRLTFATL